MESVVIDRSPSYPRTRFGSVDGRLLVSKSFNTTRSNSLLGQNSTTFNASFTPSLLHQPPLLPLPLPTTTTVISRGAFPRRPRHKKPFNGEARRVVVIDKPKEKEASSLSSSSSSSSLSLSSFVCSVSPPPPSSVPMPRFTITRGKKAAAAVAAAGGSAAGNCVAVVAAEGDGCGGVDVCATDGLRRLLRI